MQTESKMIGVQYLRAIAALMIAFHHVRGQIPPFAHDLSVLGMNLDGLRRGVDVFFVISGFVMVITSRKGTPGTFLLRRIIRVAPLYWIMTALTASLFIAAPQLFRRTQITPISFLKSMLFVPYNSAQGDMLRPILAPGWTLNLEMFFYAIFALLLFLPAKLRVPVGGVVFVVLVTFGTQLTDPANEPVLWLYTRPIVLEFWIGMVIAQCYLSGVLRLPRWLSAAIAVCGFATLLAPESTVVNSWITHAVAAGAVVSGTVALERAGGVAHSSWLALWGDASYSIYLTHPFTLGFARVLWSRIAISAEPGALLLAVSSMIMVVLVAVLVYRFVEAPLLELSKRWVTTTRWIKLKPRQTNTSP
jgi:exopolysaccharide production protein ExoZ